MSNQKSTNGVLNNEFEIIDNTARFVNRFNNSIHDAIKEKIQRFPLENLF